MSKKTFFICLAVLGVIYVGAAGSGFLQSDGDSSSDPADAKLEFSKKFSWLKGAKLISRAEFSCDPSEVCPAGQMKLVLTPDEDTGTLTIKAEDKRSLKLICPKGAELTIEAPSPKTGEFEKAAFLPTDSKGNLFSEDTSQASDDSGPFRNATWTLKAGDTVKVQCTKFPDNKDQCIVEIGGGD